MTSPAKRITYGESYQGNVIAIIVKQPTPAESNYHLFLHTRDDFEPGRAPPLSRMFFLNDLTRQELDNYLEKLQIGHLTTYELQRRHLDDPYNAARAMAIGGFRNFTYASRREILMDTLSRGKGEKAYH